MSVNPHRQNTKLPSISAAESVQVFPQGGKHNSRALHTHQTGKISSSYVCCYMNSTDLTKQIGLTLKYTHMGAVSAENSDSLNIQNNPEMETLKLTEMKGCPSASSKLYLFVALYFLLLAQKHLFLKGNEISHVWFLLSC
ncbi:hypothetical protein XENORESO_012985 [Xenotaenia resolanae]|uniref:Uncharacterized protein n=1 Tax=Xenotaenia resolanae TaxID=208358 RepID=A0ABV0VZI5_9TELE